MEVRLEKEVDGEWYPWGTYDLSKDRDLAAYTQACVEVGRNFKIRAVRVNNVYEA